MNFRFNTSADIIFGPGTIEKLEEIAPAKGRRAMLVTGRSSDKNGSLERLVSILKKAGVKYRIYCPPAREPEPEDVDRGVETALEWTADLIIALGGGSILDTGKAISGLCTNRGSVKLYLEGIGDGRAIEKPSLPFIAIPTTAGTGSEVTKNAVISSRAEGWKKSMRSPLLIPDVALIDPLLTVSCPPEITAHCGMDALTQLIEPVVSRKAQPFTSALAIYGIPLVARSLSVAVEDGSNITARENMSLASLLSGCALANSGLGAVHGISAILGARFGVPHGLACAVLLPHVMELNISAEPGKFAEIGTALTGGVFSCPEEAGMAGVEFIRDLSARIRIPEKLIGYGLKKSDIPDLIRGSGGSSMSGNPRELSYAEIEGILEKVIL